jgi:hypothetical protein
MGGRIIMCKRYNQKKTSEKKPFLFIHIPKNAGTSIENMFLTNKIEIGRHKIENNVIENIGVNEWHCPPKYRDLNFNDYIAFCVVRHPIDRIISEFNYMHSIDWIEIPDDINKYVKEALGNNVDQFAFDGHLIPQSEFIQDKYGNVITTILKFENLESELKLFMKKHRLKYKIEKANSSNKINSIKDLNSESLRLIKSFYKNDFVLFDYD